MSQGNQHGVSRPEFDAIKPRTKQETIAAIAKDTKRSMSTISKIRRASSYAKFLELNKGYAAVQTNRRHQAKVTTTEAQIKRDVAPAKKPRVAAKKTTPKAQSTKATVVIKQPKTAAKKIVVNDAPVAVRTPAKAKKLIDTLNKPERLSKKRAAEILGLRMELEVAKKERDDHKAAAASLRKQLSNQQAENIRLSMAFNRAQRTPLNRIRNALKRKAEV